MFEQDLTADAVVVGAGIAGLSIANEFASRGLSVACIDQGVPGATCSQASLGLIYPVSPLTAPSVLCSLSVRAHADYPEFVERTSEESGLAVRLYHHGLVHVAFEGSQVEELHETRAAYQSIGYEVEVSTTPSTYSVFRVPAVGSMVHPTAMSVDAKGLLRALEWRLRRLGGQVLSMEPIVGLVLEGESCKGVVTTARRVSAPIVVLCNGAWLTYDGTVAGERATEPIRGQILVMQPVEEFNIPFAFYTPELDIIPRDGRVLIGSTIEAGVADPLSTIGGVEELLGYLKNTLVGFDALRLVDVVVGVRSRARDQLPIVGTLAQAGLYALGGMFRNGVYMAPLLASLLAARIIDGADSPEIDPMTPGRLYGGL